jgi:hypothetical protein
MHDRTRAGAVKFKFSRRSSYPQQSGRASGTHSALVPFFRIERASSVMRALQVILTVLGFATIFAVLMVSSAIITATVHKAIAAAPIGAIRS